MISLQSQKCLKLKKFLNLRSFLPNIKFGENDNLILIRGGSMKYNYIDCGDCL